MPSLWSCDNAPITVRAISGVIDGGFGTRCIDFGGSFMSSAKRTDFF
jgi:hypothetical protein